MKIRQMRTILLATAVACTLGIVGCGSTGSISSLTDNDSTAALTEDTAAAGTTDTAAGTVTKAENENNAGTGEAVLPEIQAQAVEETPAAEETAAAETADAEEEKKTEAVEEVPVESDSDTASPSPASAEPAAQQESDDTDVSYENDEDPEAVAAADAVDVAETDEGGAHGEGNTATVIADDVNVRSYPEVDEDDDNVLGTLSYGEQVKVLGNEEGWYKIEFEGQIGYASANFFE